MNLITIFVCFSFLPVSFFFYLLSLTVNKTVQQEKLLKTKPNIVGTFFERFQFQFLVSGTNPMLSGRKWSFFENDLNLATKFIIILQREVAKRRLELGALICCENVPYLWEKIFHASLKV